METTPDFQFIQSNIRKHIQLNQKEKQYFLALLKPMKVAKRKLLLRQSEKYDQIYFVNKGLLRSYSIGQDGKEATVMSQKS